MTTGTVVGVGVGTMVGGRRGQVFFSNHVQQVAVIHQVEEVCFILFAVFVDGLIVNQEMIVVGSTYWNMVYGQMPEDVLKDEEGLANMRNFGENMAYLLNALERAKRLENTK